MSESDASSPVGSPPPTPTSQVEEDGNAATNQGVKPKVQKVEVLLKATGNAPIIKKKKWALEPTKKIGYISEFLKKLIKCEPHESLFLYVNQAFAPSPDMEVGTLFECFGSDGKLILHYCMTQAWG